MNQSQPSYPNATQSFLSQKKEEFRKEIRRQKMNQEFASRRKILFREHTAQLIRPTDNQFIPLSSWDEVKQQLPAFMPNFKRIHVYIHANYQQGIPQDIEQLLISLVNRPQFLTNEESLALLITLTVVKNKENKSIFEPGMIKLIVDNLLKWSLVKVEINGKAEDRIHYFETVCWTLVSFARICENNMQEVFETFRQNMAAFETSSPQLCYQQMTLFSQLSTNPSFLPSSAFIRDIINKSFKSQSQKSNLTIDLMVPLLDNFMRYKQQNPHRFEQEEDKELTTLYVKFIYEKLEDMTFAKTRKVELISLLTTLINSASETILEVMFGTEEAMKLVGLIFYNAEYESWQVKKASLSCIMVMMSNSILLPYLSKRINPSDIAYLCYNSLLLPDAELQREFISSILCACCVEPQIYVKEFRKYSLSAVVKKLEYFEAKNGQNIEQEMSLSDRVGNLDECLKFWEGQMNQKGNIELKRQEYISERDVEI